MCCIEILPQVAASMLSFQLYVISWISSDLIILKSLTITYHLLPVCSLNFTF